MSSPADKPRNTTSDPDERAEELTVPLVAETLDVDVQEQTTGRVRVSVRNEKIEQRIEETLSNVSARVERIPIGRELDAGEEIPGPRMEDGVSIVPVLEERLVIEKRLVLVEEVRIESVTETQSVSAPITLRRQQLEIEQRSGDPVDTDPPVETSEQNP